MLGNLHVPVDEQPRGPGLDSESVELAVEVFAMLADATRVHIVLALWNAGELSVSSLTEVVRRSHP